MPSVQALLLALLALGVLAVGGMAGASGSEWGPILDAMGSVTTDSVSIKTSLLTILGVIVTVGIAWVIVRAIRS